MTNTRRDGLKALGLRRFMDTRYYKYGGYIKLDQMLAAGANNAQIAAAFSEPERPMHRQSVRVWRAKWEQEKENANGEQD